MPAQQGCTPEAVQIDREFIYDSEAYHSTTSNAFQTVLDITGRGKAELSKVIKEEETHYFRITVDGNIVMNDRALTGDLWSGCFLGIFNFNSSLLVEHRNLGGINQVRMAISYMVN